MYIVYFVSDVNLTFFDATDVYVWDCFNNGLTGFSLRAEDSICQLGKGHSFSHRLLFPTRSLLLSNGSGFSSVLMCSCPIITALNFMKSCPCNGSVKKSASITSVGKYTISMP